LPAFGHHRLSAAWSFNFNLPDYERDKLRLNAEMAVRFAIALEVSTDELLGLNSANGGGKSKAKSEGKKPSRRVLRRLEKIESLPAHQQPSS